jgi:hypothetical protein
MAVRRAHHGNLNALIGKCGDTSCPFSFDRGTAFELKAELLKEINRPSEVIDDDSYVIQPFERHASNLQDVAWMQQRTLCNAELRAAQSLPDRSPTQPLIQGRAVQISWMGDFVGLILLGKRMLRPGIAKAGLGVEV